MEKEQNAGQQPEGQERKRVTVSRRSYLAMFFVAVMLLFGLVCKIDEVLHPDRVEKAEAAYQQMVQSFKEELGMPADSINENPEVDTTQVSQVNNVVSTDVRSGLAKVPVGKRELRCGRKLQ